MKTGRPANDSGIRWRGDALRHQREWGRRGRLTLEQLASVMWNEQAYEVSRSRLHQWEGGDEPPARAVSALARVFRCRRRDFERRPG